MYRGIIIGLIWLIIISGCEMEQSVKGNNGIRMEDEEGTKIIITNNKEYFEYEDKMELINVKMEECNQMETEYEKIDCINEFVNEFTWYSGYHGSNIGRMMEEGGDCYSINMFLYKYLAKKVDGVNWQSFRVEYTNGKSHRVAVLSGNNTYYVLDQGNYVGDMRTG